MDECDDPLYCNWSKLLHSCIVSSSHWLSSPLRQVLQESHGGQGGVARPIRMCRSRYPDMEFLVVPECLGLGLPTGFRSWKVLFYFFWRVDLHHVTDDGNDVLKMDGVKNWETRLREFQRNLSMMTCSFCGNPVRTRNKWMFPQSQPISM